ncbi:MAG: nitrate/nitrite transporter NrtS [Myxococcota bacterium]
MLEWIREASSWPVVRRALLFALVVGAILIAINHGAAIVRGEVGAGHLVQMGLTVLVPYTVSTLSSVLAMRALERDG